MKKAVFLYIIVILMYSCKKENDRILPENPQWLTEKIFMMETPAEYAGTTVFAYKWNKEYYYLIQVPLANCGMCEFYDYKGIRFIWTDEKLTDFYKSAKMIQIVWHREELN
jgi:hypothetical protein